MSRRIISSHIYFGQKWHTYSCYIKNCDNKEYKFRMCEHHLNKLKGKNSG